MTAPVHVAEWGTYVTSPQVMDDKATVSVKTEVRNDSTNEAKIEIRHTILDSSGKTVSKGAAPSVAVSADATRTVPASLTVTNPQRWDMDHPYLYTLVTEIVDGDRVIDKYSTTFGIRTIAFDREKGFLLNGKARKLHGVCLHHHWVRWALQ